MKKTIPIILIASFSCSLAGCSTRRQVSQEVTSSNEVHKLKKNQGMHTNYQNYMKLIRMI